MRDRTPTLIRLIADAVAAWRAREGNASRETVTQLMVEAYEKLGGPAITGLTFSDSGDACRRMQTNAERMFRWLDDMTKDSTLLPANLVPFVLAALPEDLRISVVNEFLAPSGMSVQLIAGESANLLMLAQQVSREAGEATAAIIDLSAGESPGKLRAAQQQVTEAIKPLQDVLAHIEKDLGGVSHG